METPAPTSIKTTDIVSHGAKIVQASFQSDKGWTREQVKQIVEQYENKELGTRGDLCRQVTTKHQKTVNSGTGEVEVSTHESHGWRSGRWTLLGQEPSLYSVHDHYEVPDNFADTDKIHEFQIYYAKNGVSGGDDQSYNDCLWYCLRNAYISTEYMPGPLSAAPRMKKWLKLARKNRVPISLIPKIEERGSITINVIGDHIYQSKAEHQRQITLKLEDSHYSLESNKNDQLTKDYHSRKSKIIFFKKINKGDAFQLFDGMKQFECTIKEFQKLVKSSRIFLMQGGSDLKQSYAEWKLVAHELKEADPILDLHKSGNLKNMIKWIFHNKTRSVIQPDKIQQDEARWLLDTKRCGLIGCTKGTYGHATDYDFNYYYGDIMRSAMRKFPVKRGTFNHLDHIPDILKYGIYRCIITPSGQPRDRFFMFNKQNRYTHIDINCARRMELGVELIQDSQMNALVYEKSCLITGHLLFKPTVDYCFDLRSKTKVAKKLGSLIWGVLCEKSTIWKNTVGGPVDCKGYEIQQIQPIGEDHHYVKLIKQNAGFVTDYARVGPFVTAFGRTRLSGLCRKYGDRVVAFHTDGLVITGSDDSVTTGKGIGELKVKNEGVCVVLNANSVKFAT